VLVLSRKLNQTIRFPNLGISIEILRVAGNTVRVGVDAPVGVLILRGELADEATISSDRSAEAESQKNWRHEVRNKLNSANLALEVLQKLLDAGRVAEAEKTLKIAISSFAALDQIASSRISEPKVSKKPSVPCVERRRALIVEDCANERELLAGYLRLCGYIVDVVEDGEAAMKYLAEHQRPDVVLLDMNMPRLDGPRTVEAIRSNPAYRGLKLFVVSGLDREAVKLSTGDRGIDRWFQKPLRPGLFVHALAEELKSVAVLHN